MSVYKEIIEHKVPTYKKGETNEDIFVRELFTPYSENWFVMQSVHLLKANFSHNPWITRRMMLWTLFMYVFKAAGKADGLENRYPMPSHDTPDAEADEMLEPMCEEAFGLLPEARKNYGPEWKRTMF